MCVCVCVCVLFFYPTADFKVVIANTYIELVMSKHHLAGSGILIHLMALMTLRGRYYYYLSPNMKKTE